MEEITSRNHSLIKLVNRLQKSRKEREKEQKFVAEGLRLCLDARESGMPIDLLCFTSLAQKKHSREVADLAAVSKTSIEVSQSVFDKMSGTKAPQGILCLLPLLDKWNSPATIKTGGSYLIIEELSDPGNAGTILRTAEALGLSGVILAGSCVDVYSPKVVRATMGALFRLPLFFKETGSEAVKDLQSLGYCVWAALPCRDAMPLSSALLGKGHAVAVGNEGHGLEEATVQACDRTLTIDMQGRGESLNAAAASSILMWEMTRNRKVEKP